MSQHQKEYAEKVKSYTKYETDRKLSKNIELFTKEEIEGGKLELENSAMMRIVVKWCQELKAAYDSTRQRSEPFRMKDGKEEFINTNYHRPLHKRLREEKEKVNDKLIGLLLITSDSTVVTSSSTWFCNDGIVK